MTEKKKIILEAVEKLTDTYRKEELFLGKDRERLPNKKEIINFIKDMRSIIFPGYFSVDSSASVFPEHYVAYRLNDLAVFFLLFLLFQFPDFGLPLGGLLPGLFQLLIELVDLVHARAPFFWLTSARRRRNVSASSLN